MIIAADVGGTKTLLQLLERTDGGARALFERRYADAAFGGFDELLTRFLADARAQAIGPGDIETAVLGVAGPVDGDRVRLTNRPWEIDGTALAARFGIGRVRLVNDFVAAASGIAQLAPSDLAALQPGEPVARVIGMARMARLDRIELSQVVDPSSAMGRWVARRGDSLYMCYLECDDVPALVARLAARGARFTPRGADPARERDGLWIHPGALHGLLLGVSRPTLAWQWSGRPELVAPA